MWQVAQGLFYIIAVVGIAVGFYGLKGERA